MTTTSLFVNRATAKLAVGIVAGDTALTLVAGSGVFFPAPAAGEFFRLVLQKGTGQTDLREYMICTSRAGDVLTVTRGQEGTPPAVFDPGDELSQVITAATATSFAQKVGAQLQGALTVEADPTVALGIATKQFVESGRVNDAPADGKDYARKDTAWHALGAAAGLAVPIPISAGGTGGATLPAAQTNLVIGVTTIDDNPPATPKYGDRWIRPGNMTEMVWVPNAGGGGAGVWINPMDATSEAYPLAISKGGTGATDAPTALTNLGGTTVGKALFTTASAAAARATLGSTVVGDAVFIAATQLAGRAALGIVESTTSPWLLSDGTVAAPGLAFNSEPGLGFYRSATGIVRVASGGSDVFVFGASAPATTAITITPRQASGIAAVELRNNKTGTTDYNVVAITQNANGSATINTAAQGTATRGNLTLDAPSVSLTGSLAVNGGNIDVPNGLIHTHNGYTYDAEFCNGMVPVGFQPGSTRTVAIFDAGSIGDTAFMVVQHVPGTLTQLNCTVGGGGKTFIMNNTGNFYIGGDGFKAVAGPWLGGSDERVKTNVRDYEHGLAEVLNLRPIVYNFRAETEQDTEAEYISLIGQEVETVLPETISIQPYKMGDLEFEDFRVFNPNAITYALINAVKTLNERLAALEAA